MKKLKSSVLVLFTVYAFGQTDTKMVIPDKAIQIKTATLPIPEADQANAMVYGYNTEGELIVLREGSNLLVCLADDPSKEGISVSCYVKSLEPFMKRGRELTTEGKNAMEKRTIRGQEVTEGKLKMPTEPSMTYIYYGSEEDYDPKTGDLKNGQFRYVIYTPFATPESTGLPIAPHAKGMPWLMDPGTFRAHIMIGPF